MNITVFLTVITIAANTSGSNNNNRVSVCGNFNLVLGGQLRTQMYGNFDEATADTGFSLQVLAEVFKNLWVGGSFGYLDVDVTGESPVTMGDTYDMTSNFGTFYRLNVVSMYSLEIISSVVPYVQSDFGLLLFDAYSLWDYWDDTSPDINGIKKGFNVGIDLGVKLFLPSRMKNSARFFFNLSLGFHYYLITGLVYNSIAGEENNHLLNFPMVIGAGFDF